MFELNHFAVIRSESESANCFWSGSVLSWQVFCHRSSLSEIHKQKIVYIYSFSFYENHSQLHTNISYFYLSYQSSLHGQWKSFIISTTLSFSPFNFLKYQWLAFPSNSFPFKPRPPKSAALRVAKNVALLATAWSHPTKTGFETVVTQHNSDQCAACWTEQR